MDESECASWSVTESVWAESSTIQVVVAHPDDESFALGGLLAAAVARGAVVDLLCLTQGEASTLGADEVARGGLAEQRAEELAQAGALLGLRHVRLMGFPDGGLGDCADQLPTVIEEELDRGRADLVLIFDPQAGVTGHPDHRQASLSALQVARTRGLPVLGWALPVEVADQLNDEYHASFYGYPHNELWAVSVDRGTQRQAIACHASQAVPGSVLWRRLELLSDWEYLRSLES